ncbi:MAG TPA: heme exporter protein CcmD [Casimicrobiaceae bacterium]|jgi:heme exporter protein D|nr:heme exporter protein CcmD [Pseudomonadota bacterium]HEV2040488.1 heme exporter protein CcmD [Casimicrobiaceae bacterium]HVR93923.1 heme exporter protein CcmD [Casimicrobiaceae bacterium]
MKASGLSEFLAMGGYGFYVWTSYVVAAIAVAVEIVAVRARLRAAVKSALKPDRAATLPDDTQ